MLNFNQYIDLNRRFVEFNDKDDPEQIAYNNYTKHYHEKYEGMTWDELYKSKLVIVLGEPGSGKTWEFEYQAKKLQNEKYAFYIPLDRMIDKKIEDYYYGNDQILLSQWKKSNTEAWFFFDSVDESKFNDQNDFVKALDNIAKSLDGISHDRFNFLISSRISEWRINTDLKVILDRFPFHSNMSIKINDEDKDNLRKDFKTIIEEQHEEADNNNQNIPRIRIVKIRALEKEDVIRFAKGLGIVQHKQFISAIERKHAWDFAQRPLDVIDLINYWEEKNALGTLKELIEYSISKKICETQDKQRKDPLSTQQAQLGIECLAAATQFCKRFNFLVPDSIPHNHQELYIDAKDCLPDNWEFNSIHSLLNRAIFDSASFGLIRFHHRRISEYLAACWMYNRIDKGGSYPIIEKTLFIEKDNKLIIPDNYKPIVAWLSIYDKPWSKLLRTKILTCQPELFLLHGDPESLPKDYKIELFRELINKFSNRRQLYLDIDNELLSRFSDPDLGPELVKLIRDTNTPDDIRILLLRIIGHSRLEKCQDTLMDIITSIDESLDIKTYAAIALNDIGDAETLKILFNYLSTLNEIESFICGIFCEALYPKIINEKDFINILKKSKNINNDTHELPQYIESYYKRELDGITAIKLLKELLSNIQEKPFYKKDNKEYLFSNHYWYLGELLPVIINHILGMSNLKSNAVRLVAQALWLLNNLMKSGISKNIAYYGLQKIKINNADVKREYFWLYIDNMQISSFHNDAFYALLSSSSFMQLGNHDISWLFIDFKNKKSINEKKIVLETLLYTSNLLYDKKYYGMINKLVKDDIELTKIFTNYKLTIIKRIRRYFYSHGIFNKKDFWRKLKKIKNKSYFQNLYIYFWLIFHINNLKNGKLIGTLSHLSDECSKNHSNYDEIDIEILFKSRGKIIANAAIDGWKTIFENWEPPLPFEKVNPNQTKACTI